jgi:hypothetical protein
MATVTTAEVFRLTQPNYHTVQAGYNTTKKEYEEFFDIEDVETADVKTIQEKMFGVAPLVRQGQVIPSTSYSDYGAKTFYINKYALQCQITREAIQDNLYVKEAPRLSQSFARSFAERENIEAADVIQKGFTPGADPTWDGGPLFNYSHPADGGSWANTFAEGVPLNETTIEAMITMCRRMLDPAGVRITDIRPEKLVVPVEMDFQAVRILQSYLRPGTGNHDINAIKHTKILSEIVLSHYISPAYFFIRTSNPGLKKFSREEMLMNSTPNYQVDEIAIIAMIRYIFGVDDPRCAVGAQQPLNIPIS